MITLLLIICFVFLSFCSINANPADSERVKKNPVFVKTQYAGNLGLISVGIGKCYLQPKLVCDLNYGFLPKEANGESVHTLGIKTSYHLRAKSIAKVERGYYFGTSLTYSIAPNTYAKYPDYYPKGYYPQNAIHLNPFIGKRWSIPSLNRNLQKTSLFAELGTVDYEIWYAIKNNCIKLSDILNLSFGLAFQFK